MMKKENAFPDNFEAYCREHPEKFGKRRVRPLKGYIFLIIGIPFAIYPGLVPVLAEWLNYSWIRILAIIFIFLGFCDVFLTKVWYNKLTNGNVKKIGIRKFDRVHTDINDILAALEKGDIEYLAEAKYTNSDPLQLHIYEDNDGQEFYCQLRLYDRPSSYKPISDVRTFSGNEYQMHREDFYSMRSEISHDNK